MYRLTRRMISPKLILKVKKTSSKKVGRGITSIARIMMTRIGAAKVCQLIRRSSRRSPSMALFPSLIEFRRHRPLLRCHGRPPRLGNA